MDVILGHILEGSLQRPNDFWDVMKTSGQLNSPRMLLSVFQNIKELGWLCLEFGAPRW